MRNTQALIVPVVRVALISLILLTVTAAWAGGKERVLHNFAGLDDCYPTAGLILDALGNLYGTTSQNNVFELKPGTDGKWAETVLYASPFYPFTAGLIFDAAGSLYTTTNDGGDGRCGSGNEGCGTVVRLSVGANGKWKPTVLHRFHGKDGAFPAASLIFDAAGNLYGTTSNSELANTRCFDGPCGTAFRLSPGQNGKWTETVLHRFSGKNGDGVSPFGSLIFDAKGNLYGTTANGGSSNECSSGCGTVFKLTPSADGKWTETVLHSFNGSDGAYPQAGLIFDARGSLYGTTLNGVVGNYCLYGSCGTVFKLTADNDGKWKETVLHKFQGTDGSSPYSSLVFDAKGNLFGTTLTNVFKLAPGTKGDWTETVLHTFGRLKYGFESYAGVVVDTVGNLYGTTTRGGADSCGVAFEIIP